MGLLNKLQQGGSTLTAFNGNTPSVNPLSTNQSNLHATPDGTSGYSLDGNFFPDVNAAFQTYLDGTNNLLPQPSQLDLGGVTPSKYEDNQPG
jgi:hypothetical protein